MSHPTFGKGRCQPLSKKMKALVWAPVESNAGVGWQARGDILRNLQSEDMMEAEYKRGSGQ